MTPTTVANAPAIDKDLLARLARTVRGLAIDAVEKANSGHPGMPMGCADFAALLWYYHLNYNPADPAWPNRDRFILSAGHGSMLIYAMLHVTGYDVPLEEVKNFRQLGSMTPGHPEVHHTPGVETTTGPLGQGFGNGVGMALAAEMMHARFGELADHRIYGIVSDGDLMEGISAEAASFAGHHGLGRLIFFYDDNEISIEGSTELTFSREDVAKRFEAYGWHVQRVDGHNFDQMNEALTEARAETDRPSLIIGRTVIGKGSPNKGGKASSHGAPLGPDEVRLTKKALGLDPDKDFDVPAADYTAWAVAAERGVAAQKAWQATYDAAPSEVRNAFNDHLTQPLPDLRPLRPAPEDKPSATRKSAGAAENAYAVQIPWLVGGSADLAPSTNTLIKNSPSVAPGAFEGRNLHFGVREHAMGAIMNGMTLHGTFRPFGATFLVFSDYMRPSVRLASLMRLPVIYIFTHDSIFVGEDGPTHQPVEHVAALRSIPGLTVIRPGDAAEAAVAWELALKNTTGPTALILTRQNLPNYNRLETDIAPVDGVENGGYVLRGCKGDPELILIATGSEMHLAVEAAIELEKDGTAVRVVSMPSLEIFRAQPRDYQQMVLPPTVRRRLVIEAGIRMGWESIATEDGDYVTQDGFGLSGPAERVGEHFGFTTANVLKKAKALLGKR